MKYLPILMLIAFVSCDMRDSRERQSDATKEQAASESVNYPPEDPKNWWRSKLQIIDIDGCEYVAYHLNGNDGLLTHKGNCKNPIHQDKK